MYIFIRVYRYIYMTIYDTYIDRIDLVAMELPFLCIGFAFPTKGYSTGMFHASWIVVIVFFGAVD